MQTPLYIVKNTTELRRGDVIAIHGMRLLLDSEPLVSQIHAGGKTKHVDARVLNIDEVRDAGFVPFSWLRRDDGSFRWVVQGNELATWAIVAEGFDL